MTRQPLKWQALILALGLGTCWIGTGPAAAQNGILYEKKLKLTENPLRSDDEAAQQPAPQTPVEKDDVFYETPMRLRALSRGLGRFLEGENGPDTRIVGGYPARPGSWLSAVYIRLGRAVMNSAGNGTYTDGISCGATLIAPNWVLTAAHCVFEEKLQGVKSLKWVTIHEGSHLRGKGERIPVVEVLVHRQYRDAPQGYDIALLKLARNAKAPPQKLAAQAGRSKFLNPGNKAKIVGWGDTAAGAGKGSEQLLEAEVPIVEQQACRAIYAHIGDVAFCAGFPQGGTDTCQGDSGGPLFVSGNHGEHVQAGITSFGRGCAQPNAYGAYTNVGQFEQWIRERVPNAYFAQPASGSDSSLDQIAGITPGGPPSPHGQVTPVIKVHPCGAPSVGVATNQVKAGLCITVEVTSAVKGKIAIFNTDADRKSAMIYPNPLSSKSRLGATPTSVRTGETIAIPGPLDVTFEFKITPPFGRNEIMALVVPDGVDLDGLTKDLMGRTLSADELHRRLDDIARITTRHVEVQPGSARRAVGTRQFLVVQ
jgi:hypothetical protein